MATGFLRRFFMANSRCSVLEHILKTQPNQRQRMLTHQLFPSFQNGCNLSTSSEENNDKKEEGIKANPYYEKYAEKIKKAQAEGSAPKTYGRDRLSHQLDVEKAQWKKRVEEMEKKLEGKYGDNSFAKGSGLPKSLSDIMKIEKIQDKTPEEISAIWRKYFEGKDAISAVIPAETYDRIHSRAQSCPTFIYPLPRQQGYEIFLAQFADHQCFFSSLVNYQAHGEEAPWQMNIAHYTELKEEKGIVLMTSEIDLNSINILEGQCLAQLMQMFYSTADEERFNLVRTFNKDPQNFRYMDVVKEVECSGLQQPLFTKK